MKLAVALKSLRQPCGEPAVKKNQIVEVLDQNADKEWTQIAPYCKGRKLWVPTTGLRILDNCEEAMQAEKLYCESTNFSLSFLKEEKVED